MTCRNRGHCPPVLPGCRRVAEETGKKRKGPGMATTERGAPGSVRCFTLTRDGETVARFLTARDVFAHLHHRHGFSVSHALAHEGYAVTDPDGVAWSPDTVPGSAQ